MSNSLNNSFITVEEEDKSSGEIHRLMPSSSSTVQPNALLRLGIFVPTIRSSERSQFATDTDGDLALQFAEKEGYTDILITGKRLDIETDFKVWLGLVQSMFTQGPESDGYLTVDFGEFIERCGYPKKRLSLKFRKLIEASLWRLASTTLKFSRDTGTERIKGHILHLVEAAKFDSDNDSIRIKPTPELQEIYKGDYKVIIKLKVFNALGRKETAKALYLFLEALPKNPYPLSMQRLRDRLNLKSATNQQNMVIRKAMKDLKDIGYLEYTELKKGQKIEFHIHKRNPELLLKKNPQEADEDNDNDE